MTLWSIWLRRGAGKCHPLDDTLNVGSEEKWSGVGGRGLLKDDNFLARQFSPRSRLLLGCGEREEQGLGWRGLKAAREFFGGPPSGSQIDFGVDLFSWER